MTGIREEQTDWAAPLRYIASRRFSPVPLLPLSLPGLLWESLQARLPFGAV